MNKVPLVVWLSVSLFLLFTGCSDDDPQSRMRAPNSGTNADNEPPLCMAPWGVRSGAILTLEDGSSRIQILLVTSFTYSLMFQGNSDSEKGTYTATPSGNLVTLILAQNPDGTTTRAIDLVISSSTQGTYTSDSLGQGTFTSDGPLFIGGCGPY